MKWDFGEGFIELSFKNPLIKILETHELKNFKVLNGDMMSLSFVLLEHLGPLFLVYPLILSTIMTR
jgi:hypothetical protein